MYNLNAQTYEIHEQIHKDRLHQAQQYRLAEIAKQGNKSPSVIRQRIAKVGNLLIILGQSMQTQSTDTNPINKISRPVS